MGRRASKVDKNQPLITQQLKELGMSVCLLHAVGSGVPDMLVGYKGFNLFVEVKHGRNVLSNNQVKFFDEWEGHIIAAYNTGDVLRGFIAMMNRSSNDHVRKLKSLEDNLSYYESNMKENPGE